MRNLIIIFGLLVLGTVAQAQRCDEAFTAATLTNSETEYFLVTCSAANDSLTTKNSTYAIQVGVVETSGSATIIATLQHSIVYNKWVDLAVSDTLINGGTPNSANWLFTGESTPARAYRVKVVQTGTAVTALTGRVYLKANE